MHVTKAKHVSVLVVNSAITRVSKQGRFLIRFPFNVICSHTPIPIITSETLDAVTIPLL